MTRTAAALAAERVSALGPELVELSHAVHTAAEIGFEETESVSAVVALLARHGVEAETGGWGLPTALRAQVGSAGPRVGVFAEYDALPGVGHGCGHNVICATAVGAFLGIAEVVRSTGGTVILFGTPAEENGSGKEVMARAGAFIGLDAAVMLHPTGGATRAVGSTTGLRSVEIAYYGRPAHASAAPHMGRNALDAMVLAYQGIAALRQHILPTERVHGYIQEGGQTANVVPERSRGRFLMRSPDPHGLAELSRRVQRILEGAALMTETRLDAEWDRVPPCLPVRNNVPLGARFAVHLEQRGYEIAEGDESTPGSTDMGNVSLRIPSIHPWLSIAPAEVAAHTVEFAACAVSERADRATIDGAVALAGVVADYLSDPALREAVAADFSAAGGAVDVEVLLAPPR